MPSRLKLLSSGTIKIVLIVMLMFLMASELVTFDIFETNSNAGTEKTVNSIYIKLIFLRSSQKLLALKKNPIPTKLVNNDQRKFLFVDKIILHC